jgi:hypothetical protein
VKFSELKALIVNRERNPLKCTGQLKAFTNV